MELNTRLHTILDVWDLYHEVHCLYSLRYKENIVRA